MLVASPQMPISHMAGLNSGHGGRCCEETVTIWHRSLKKAASEGSLEQEPIGLKC